MTNTTHYNMTIAEGTDVVNPLMQIFPNFNTIDGAMFANKQSGIGTASEVATGPVHAIVRANPDSNVFRFTATSAWTAGDTMTLDGNSVVVHMSDGTVPATGAYIIGAEVLAMVNAGLVTLVISSNGGVTSFNTRTGNVVPENSDYTAAMVDFDNTNTALMSTDVQGAIEEVSSISQSTASIIDTSKTFGINSCKRSGNVVTVALRCNNYAIAGTASEHIANISADYIPDRQIFFDVLCLDINGYPAGVALGTITTNGTLSIVTGTTAVVGFTLMVNYVI